MRPHACIALAKISFRAAWSMASKPLHQVTSSPCTHSGGTNMNLGIGFLSIIRRPTKEAKNVLQVTFFFKSADGVAQRNKNCSPAWGDIGSKAKGSETAKLLEPNKSSSSSRLNKHHQHPATVQIMLFQSKSILFTLCSFIQDHISCLSLCLPSMPTSVAFRSSVAGSCTPLSASTGQPAARTGAVARAGAGGSSTWCGRS